MLVFVDTNANGDHDAEEEVMGNGWNRFLRGMRLWGLSASGRAYHEMLRQRPRLDDDAFFEQFYSQTDVPKDIAVQLRHVCGNSLGVDPSALRPEDNLAMIYDDVDFFDVLHYVGRKFKVKIPPETALAAPFQHKGKPCTGEIDGTFDSLVRYLAKVTRGRLQPHGKTTAQRARGRS